jgi:hypothetical protein
MNRDMRNIAVALTLLVAGCGGGDTARTKVPQPTRADLEAAGLGGLPVAPDSKRVDLEAPPFSHPTRVTNPLFPVSRLRSVVLNGKVEGKPFRTETTLLPGTRTIEWKKGHPVKTLVSQYTAYLGGRIEEVALDFYAQADDGGVWYFGEEVFNYKDGYVADSSDSWLAGRDGPAAMIMPGHPRVGDASRAENIPGRVFEEVAVKRTGEAVNGPLGPVKGAMVGRELHSDGTYSDKVFAPGYGEFYTASNGEVEALAVAVPTDAAKGPPPRALEDLRRGADAVFSAAGSRRWGAAAKRVAAMNADWRALRRGAELPVRLVPPAGRALDELRRAVRTRAGTRAQNAALDVTQAALDLELRYRPAIEIDRARFDLWARQAGVDAAAHDMAAVNGDVSTLEWIRDRLEPSPRLNARLLELRTKVDDGNLPAVSGAAAKLRQA